MPRLTSNLVKRCLFVSIASVLSVVMASGSAPLGASASETSRWDVTVSPPEMDSPTEITLSSQTAPRTLASWGILCSGKYYRVRLDRNEDAVISMSGNEPLRYPVWVTGGRNVRIVGLEMDLAVQPGCEAGALPNSGSSAMSIHPRLPGAMAIRLQNYGTSFVEGVDIDLAGHESDCFVVRNPADLSNADARSQRNVIIQNTSCTGIEGLGKSSIGDGVHGDLLQNQGFDVMNRLVLENVTVRSSMEGLMLHKSDEFAGAQNLTIRRFDYAVDTRFDDDDNYEQLGVAFSAWADSWELEDVFIDDPRGNDYGFINGQRYGAFATSVLIHLPQIRSGPPPGGAFAPESRVGLGYKSPHDGLNTTNTTSSESDSSTTNNDTSGTKTSDEAPPVLAFDASDSSMAQIRRLYSATFGRSPDPSGHLYWASQLDSGLGLELIATFFQGSKEWQNRYGLDSNDSQMVDSLYLNVLGRSPDQVGRSYWLDLLSSGKISRSALLVFFSESDENRAGAR